MPRTLLNQNIVSFLTDDDTFGFPQCPAIAEKVDCQEWIGIDKAIQDKKKKGLHFYEDDYKIERLWNNPRKYINLLQKYDHIIQTDFSLYFDFPAALQIYNKFRNHWLLCFYAIHGIPMIPNIRPSTPEQWNWSFCGYPQNSVVAFSDIGACRDKACRHYINLAYEEMIKRLSPIQVLYFTRSVSSAPSECTVIPLSYIKGGV